MMLQSCYWEEISKHQWLFHVCDNSPMDKLQEKVSIESIRYSTGDEPINLGIRRINGKIYSGNYVGLCRLKDTGGNILKSYDGREVILRVDPRFNVSVVDMLNFIKGDDEFERYLAPQTCRMGDADREIEDLKNNALFYFFDGEDPIFVRDNLAFNSSIITASVFLVLLKALCSKPLMGRMLCQEENLVGKVKGKVLFGKNIRSNTLKGRNDRFYCRYLQYSENIIENQILKAALQKASLFVGKYFGSASGKENSYRDIISYCQNALSHVEYRKLMRQDLSKTKVTGCYVYYKPVIQAAKMVLNEITLEANGEAISTSYIIPYAVSMDKLFEMYVRAYFKHIGIHSYLSTNDSGIHIMKYDYKSKVLEHSGGTFASYIGGNVKPDIILYDPQTNQSVVFDVKYKTLTSSRYSREDRLQVLAYALMYDCTNVGIISPAGMGMGNRIYETNPIQSIENRQRYYNQLELDVAAHDCTSARAAGGEEEINLTDYLKSLLS